MKFQTPFSGKKEKKKNRQTILKRLSAEMFTKYADNKVVVKVTR